MGSWDVIAAHRTMDRIRVFELLLDRQGQAERVGQCAVATRPGRVKFLDRLHISPAHDGLWESCFRLIVERCGAATYDYGSPWNHEDRGPVTVSAPLWLQEHRAPPFRLDRIDFSRWVSFAEYQRSVSQNIRRDQRQAAAASTRVVRRHGWAAWFDLAHLIGLRCEVLHRNGVAVHRRREYFRHALKLACLGERAFIASARTAAGCQAAFFGVTFGENMYYLGGGTASHSGGSGSYLFLTLLEEWFRLHPNGNLYLGQAAMIDPESYVRGNLLYRRKLRATQVAGTAFSLTVSGPSSS